jgi:hypothetical protein
MKLYSSRRRFCVGLFVTLVALISFCCIYFYYHVHIRIGVTSNISDLGDIREAFFKFRETHKRWPHTMEDIYGIETSEGAIIEKHKDTINNTPYCCVTDKELFYKIGNEKPYKVLVTMSKPYRTDLWPFGQTRTIIVSFSGVEIVSPSEIIDMSHNNTLKKALPQAHQ